MKKFFYFLFFVLLVGNLKGQNEVLLRTLGRAPLAAYLSSEDELRSILKKYNEEIGMALDYFPGGTLGEEVYVKIYESVDGMPIWKEQIPIGQKIYWMIYKNGGLLRNVRWMGNDPIDAFVFEVVAGGKKFKFAAPLRCGNISLVEMSEISRLKPQKNLQRPQPPLRRENPQKKFILSQPKIYQPQVVIVEKVYSYHKRVYRRVPPKRVPKPQLKMQEPQPKPQEEIIPPQPQPVPQPVLVENPKLKIKFGTGWNKMDVSSLEYEEKNDFSSLIPKEDSLIYEEIAAWLYMPGGKGSPFTAGQKINLLSQINNFESKQSGFPFFVSVEG
ncbi:MAG: hypothetical protein GX873_00665, partial [Parcubacteria group bacterium]|nr:hypothetical protein [Parcubacteria group bacterium]